MSSTGTDGSPGAARLIRILGWLFALGSSLLLFGLFGRAVFHDRHVGEPRVSVDFGGAGEWASAGFRVWGDETHVLWLTTVNHEPPFGAPLRGVLEVRVLDPEGDVVLHRTFDGAEIEHRRPDNMAWTRLAEVDLPATGWRSWRLEARVTEPDPDFAPGGSSTVLLRPDRPTRGMGGLIYYVLPAPALLFLLGAFGVAAWCLKADGLRWPLLVTTVTGLALFVAYVAFFGA